MYCHVNHEDYYFGHSAWSENLIQPHWLMQKTNRACVLRGDRFVSFKPYTCFKLNNSLMNN